MPYPTMKDRLLNNESINFINELQINRTHLKSMSRRISSTDSGSIWAMSISDKLISAGTVATSSRVCDVKRPITVTAMTFTDTLVINTPQVISQDTLTVWVTPTILPPNGMKKAHVCSRIKVHIVTVLDERTSHCVGFGITENIGFRGCA